MAFWHIPIHCDNSPIDSMPLDDIVDWVCRPKRNRPFYHPYIKPTNGRFCTKKRVNHRKADDHFKVVINTPHYDPSDITLKVDNDKLQVKGESFKKHNDGYDSYEFERSYTIPEDVDKKGFKSKINDEGELEILAPKVKQEADQNAVKAMQEDEKRFKAVFDVTDYKPGEVSVKVQGNRVIVHGEQKSEIKDDDKDVLVHHRQFTRRFVLPDTVDLDTIQSKWTKDGTLVIEADKHASIGAESRPLEIEHESSDEAKKEE